MTAFASFFDSRVSFEVAALCVTWIGVVLLGLVIGNLHLRLQRLEAASATSKKVTPYSHLLGRQIQDLIGDVSLTTPPQVFVFLSSACRACKQVLNELESLSWTAPSAVVWTDRPPPSSPTLPPNTIILDEGPKLSAKLGIRVTPFVLVAEEGTTVKAAPINTLSSLDSFVSGSTNTHLGH